MYTDSSDANAFVLYGWNHYFERVFGTTLNYDRSVILIGSFALSV